jgi:hypothetical protein
MTITTKTPTWNKTDRPAVRIVLEGVPKVGFYSGGQRCPEDIPFPSCMRAVLDYFDEGMGQRYISAHTTTWRLDNTYTYLMGVSGCAFRLSWRDGWYGENTDIRNMCPDPAAPLARAFQAAGYGMETIERTGASSDETIFRSAILRSISRSCPVIAFGVIGPPEACLITGYDQSGDVLTGWNFFQNFPEYQDGITFERSGYFRKNDWFASTQSLLLFGEKQPLPAREAIDREALTWALAVMRTSRHSEWAHGHAAYRAWSEALLEDADFPAGDMETLRKRFIVHDDAVGMVAEGRWYGAKFLEMLAESYPQVEGELISAAGCFEMEHDLMWQVWGMVGGNGRSDEQVRKLAEPATRREVSAAVLRALEQDIEAAGWIEQALSRM